MMGWDILGHWPDIQRVVEVQQDHIEVACLRQGTNSGRRSKALAIVGGFCSIRERDQDSGPYQEFTSACAPSGRPAKTAE
jgi:hypothetical protein